MRANLSYLLIISCIGLQAQNLVPNPSFEDLTTCPTGYGQIRRAEPWFRGGISSPDLMNVCDAGDTCGVPLNTWGYQWPASGDGYCGMWAYSNAQDPIYGLHEIIGARLLSPLTVGQTYWASIKVSWTSSTPEPEVLGRYATDKMGILLKMDSTFSQDNWLPWANHAHVYTEEIVSDSVNWTTIAGQFIADSAYRFVYVGNFFSDGMTDTLLVDANGDTDLSYYYVDDVCVSHSPADCAIADHIDDDSDSESIRAYVSGNLLIISGTPIDQTIQLDLFNPQGLKVLAAWAGSDSSLLQQELPSIAAGLYFLQIRSRRQIQTIPLFISSY